MSLLLNKTNKGKKKFKRHLWIPYVQFDKTTLVFLTIFLSIRKINQPDNCLTILLYLTHTRNRQTSIIGFYCKLNTFPGAQLKIPWRGLT